MTFPQIDPGVIRLRGPWPMVNGVSPIFTTKRYPRSTLARWHKRGAIVRRHPGIYVATAAANDPGVRLRAAQVHRIDGIFTGQAAAFIAFPRSRELPRRLKMASNRTWNRQELSEHRRRIPPEWIVERDGLRYTHPAWTAVELAAWDGGDTIDEFLREGGELDVLFHALACQKHSRGQRARAVIVRESSSNPWSRAERKLHAIAHRQGIRGWRANVPVTLGDRHYVLDAAIEGIKLDIEADGWRYHGSRTAFEADRERQNTLVAAGWTVLRFTWPMLTEEPELVAHTIKRTVARLRRRRGPPPIR